MMVEIETSAIDYEIRAMFRTVIDKTEGHHPSFGKALHIAANSALGGKLLRPRLFLDLYEVLADPDDKFRYDGVESPVKEIAAAIEVLHFAFLLHDDVIDGDFIRRGRPNFISRLAQQSKISTDGHHDAERKEWARSSAILIGDLLLAEVHQVFARLDLPHAKRLQLLDLLDHAITDSIIGEFMDVSLSKGLISPQLADVQQMSRLKTATYTFELPLCSAAIMAGYDPQKSAEFATLGGLLGLLFQFQDDFLSAFGNQAEHGKDELSDVREGKETLIIAYARKTAAWPLIQPYFGNANLNKENIREIKELLVTCGAQSFLEDTIAHTARLCRDQILRITAFSPAEVPVLLNALVDSLEGRRS